MLRRGKASQVAERRDIRQSDVGCRICDRQVFERDAAEMPRRSGDVP
jgi:hypothetical protein